MNMDELLLNLFGSCNCNYNSESHLINTEEGERYKEKQQKDEGIRTIRVSL